jgi:single-strand DNA-binding protein
MLNQTILLGRLTRDPELKTVSDGASVANFTLAVDRPKYGDKEKQTDFVNIVAWRKTAEFVSKYFVKGQLVYVSGRLQTRTWQAEDGTKRYATEVVSDDVGFAEGKRKTDGSGAARTPANGDPAFADTSTFGGFGEFEGSDDLPF